ncbi:MAG: hypothetical protein ACFFD8_06045 [Candidatus Thorarchaeota archaeon]
MAITKVAAFIQGPPEAMKNGFSSTPEADLVSALMYLRNQVQQPIPYLYLSRLYLPFFLVHALPGRSLIISGVGEPTISVRHSSIPSLAQMRAELRSIERLELVPNLLGKLIQAFETPPTELVVIRNAMLPTMIDTLRLLVDSSIMPPHEDVILQSRLSTKETHDVGILFRNERARLDGNLAQLTQSEALINEFVEEQLRILDSKRDRMSHGASLRWETTPIESEPHRTTFFVEDTSQSFEKEKERISQELSDLIGNLENTLGLSTEQCRRLISQIHAKPSDVEWHLANVRTRLTELQNTANAFRSSIENALTQIEAKSEELKEIEEKFKWSQQPSWTSPETSPGAPAFPVGTLSYSDSSDVGETTAAQLKELEMVREATVKLHFELRESIKNLKNQIEHEHRQFETISAPADTLQGYLPLMRLVIPVFIVKIGLEEGRYGVIPPLRIGHGSATTYQVSLFDEVFGEQIIQLLRTEIRTNLQFQQTLDKKAQDANWVSQTFSEEHVQRGTRQLANYGLLSFQTRELIANFWSEIRSM